MNPGKMVLLDQIESSTPGLVTQMTHFLTKKQYKCATIFVDNVTSFGFIRLQLTTSAEETLQGKSDFKRDATNAGMRIGAYQAYSRVFKAKPWIANCNG